MSLTGPSLQTKPGGGRRRVPRRSFDTVVGVLYRGTYATHRSYQVGEGGMMISCDGETLVEGSNVVISFFLPNTGLIIVRAIVRSVIAADKDKRAPARYGIEFLTLDFQFKREIRNFVAAATKVDGHLS